MGKRKDKAEDYGNGSKRFQARVPVSSIERGMGELNIYPFSAGIVAVAPSKY